MPKGTDREVRVLDGSTFFVSDAIGDARETLAQGLFFRDTRFLSAETLKVEGERPIVLSTDEVDYFSATFYLTLPFQTAMESHPLTIVRSRLVGDGAHEDLMVGNFGPEPVDLAIALEFDCDFADLFQVKSGMPPLARREVEASPAEGSLAFVYRIGAIEHRTLIECGPDVRIEDRRAIFRARVEAKGWWKT